MCGGAIAGPWPQEQGAPDSLLSGSGLEPGHELSGHRFALLHLDALRLGPTRGPLAGADGDVRAARARAGLDQAVIVERMRALGFTTWHRQTQGKAERGERRLLGAGEIMALAWCLGTTVFELLKPADTDGLIRFPSGDVIAAHSVAMSVGSYNDQAVTWQDGEPRFALTGLDHTISIVRHPRFPASPAKE